MQGCWQLPETTYVYYWTSLYKTLPKNTSPVDVRRLVRSRRQVAKRLAAFVSAVCLLYLCWTGSESDSWHRHSWERLLGRILFNDDNCHSITRGVRKDEIGLICCVHIYYLESFSQFKRPPPPFLLNLSERKLAPTKNTKIPMPSASFTVSPLRLGQQTKRQRFFFFFFNAKVKGSLSFITTWLGSSFHVHSHDKVMSLKSKAWNHLFFFFSWIDHPPKGGINKWVLGLLTNTWLILKVK